MVEGGFRPSAWRALTLAALGQVAQAAWRSNWAEGPGPGRELRVRRQRLSLCWEPGQRRRKRRRNWGPLLSGLSPWTAAGECSQWLEGGFGRSSGAQNAGEASSPPARPYFCLPLRHRKPCVHVWSRWEDHTWRLQSSNCVHKVAERLVRARPVPKGRDRAIGKAGTPQPLKGVLQWG